MRCSTQSAGSCAVSHMSVWALSCGGCRLLTIAVVISGARQRRRRRPASGSRCPLDHQPAISSSAAIEGRGRQTTLNCAIGAERSLSNVGRDPFAENPDAASFRPRWNAPSRMVNCRAAEHDNKPKSNSSRILIFSMISKSVRTYGKYSYDGRSGTCRRSSEN